MSETEDFASAMNEPHGLAARIAELEAHVEALEGERDAHHKRASDQAQRASEAEHRERVALGRVEALEGALRLIADGSWNHGNLVPGLRVEAFARAALAGESPTTCPENCALKGTGTPHSQHIGHTVPTGPRERDMSAEALMRRSAIKAHEPRTVPTGTTNRSKVG